MKVKNKKSTPKNEFRRNRTNGHPAYIFERRGNHLVYIGLTHAKTTDGIDNILLSKNPNPKDKKKSHLLPNPNVDRVNKFKPKEKGWAFSSKDKDKVEFVKKQSIKKRPNKRSSSGRTTQHGLTSNTGCDYRPSKTSSKLSQRSRKSVAKTKSKVKTKKKK